MKFKLGDVVTFSKDFMPYDKQKFTIVEVHEYHYILRRISDGQLCVEHTAHENLYDLDIVSRKKLVFQEELRKMI